MTGIDPRATAGQMSPDGMWRWDGARWELVSTLAASAPASSARTSRRSVLATVAGIQALVAAPFILACCIFPYVCYTDTSRRPRTGSVVNTGYASCLYYAAGP